MPNTTATLTSGHVFQRGDYVIIGANRYRIVRHPSDECLALRFRAEAHPWAGYSRRFEDWIEFPLRDFCAFCLLILREAPTNG